LLNKFRLAVGLFLAGAVATVVGACGLNSGGAVYPMPQTMYVSYQGQNYCGYVYDQHEIDMYGMALTCQRVMFPGPNVAVVPGTLDWYLLSYLETYDGFYHSGFWYDQYYAPIGPRFHVSVYQKTTYLSYTHTFDTKYSRDIGTKERTAKWSNGKAGNYTFPSNNSKARNKPLTNNAKNYTGNSTSAGNSSSYSNSRDSKIPSRSSTTTGKSGTKSTYGGGGSRRR
jgi:hypothetical protein